MCPHDEEYYTRLACSRALDSTITTIMYMYATIPNFLNKEIITHDEIEMPRIVTQDERFSVYRSADGTFHNRIFIRSDIDTNPKRCMIKDVIGKIHKIE